MAAPPKLNTRQSISYLTSNEGLDPVRKARQTICLGGYAGPWRAEADETENYTYAIAL